MGKGDKKTKKGKIFMGSYGKSRPQRATTAKTATVKSRVCRHSQSLRAGAIAYLLKKRPHPIKISLLIISYAQN
jgi:30S ribosomal protein S31